MKTLTIEELVTRYGIREGVGCKSGMLQVCNIGLAKEDGQATVMGEIKARKPEILAYLKIKRNKEEKAEEERKAKINAIPGLQEIRDAQNALDRWNYKFERSFEGNNAIGGAGVGPRPNVDIKALREKYPVADAYLRAEAESLRSIAPEAGRKAMEHIMANHNDYAAALEEMHTAVIVAKRLWLKND